MVRLTLILSHGNVTVESGFLVNGNISIDSLQEKLRVLKRIVCSTVQSVGGLTLIQIDNTLLTFVTGSHAKYLKAPELDRQLAAKKMAL